MTYGLAALFAPLGNTGGCAAGVIGNEKGIVGMLTGCEFDGGA